MRNRTFGEVEDGLDDDDEGEEEDNGESKEDLIQRLRGLVRRLEGDGDVREGTVKRILGSVEGIERVVENDQGRRGETRIGRVRLDEVGRWERESYFGESPSPEIVQGKGRKRSGRGSGLELGIGEESELDTTIQQQEQVEVGISKEKELEISPSKAAEIARAAEELAESLGATVAEFISRKEESDVSILFSKRFVN